MEFSTNDLSEREREILRLVATGASNKEIAARLVISPNTVKVHLRHVFNKIGVASRTEAALYAVRAGLVETGQVMSPSETPAAPLSRPQTPGAQVWRWAALAALLLTALAAWRWLSATGQNAPLIPTAEAVRWQAGLNLPEGRAGMALVGYEGGLLLLGGETQDGVSADVLGWQPGESLWRARAAKPTPVRDAGAALLGEKVYLAGGQTPDGGVTDAFEMYDPRADVWSQRARLPRALSGAALAVFEGQIFLFGGWDGAQARAECYRYDAAPDRWTALSPLDGGRAFAAAVALDGKIALLGGFDGVRALDKHAWYFPGREGGAEAVWEARAPLPAGRFGFGAAALPGQIVALGGAQSRETFDALPVLLFQMQEGRWYTLPDPPQPVGGFSALTLLDSHLHVLGGRAPGGLSAAHQSYQALYTLLLPLIP